MNVNLTMNGCGISISLVDLRREQFHICRNKWGEVHLVAIPSAKWVQDMKDDGWEILHTIDNKRIDPKPAVTAQAPLAPNPQ